MEYVLTLRLRHKNPTSLGPLKTKGQLFSLMSLLKVDKSDSNSYIIISEHYLNYLFILTQMVKLLKQSKHEHCLCIVKDKL